MAHYRKELFFNTSSRYQFILITGEIRKAVKESGIQEGLCLVNAMHITASVFVNDNETGLHKDFMEWLEKIAPYSEKGYHHNVGEDNGDAHLKREIMGREVVLAVSNGDLDLGPWEEVFYGEFNGKRKKRALIKIIGE